MELFTVIAVIAILIGIAYPAFTSVMERARKTQAKNDLTQIVTAVNGYYTEYGKYPLTTGTDVTFTGATAGTTSGSSNAALIDVLRDNTTSAVNAATVTTWNPRGIVFIQPPLAKDQTGPKSGIKNSTGIWYDPWGSPYNVAIDGNYNNVVVAPTYTDLATTYTTAAAPNADVGVPVGVISWAFGKNGVLGGGAPAAGFTNEPGTAGNFSGSGDVISWQ